MSNITIGIGAEFKGKKAFKDAEKSTSALEKGVKKLGKQLAGVFAAQQVTAFAKASIKAFAEEEKSAAILANTMKNLGMAFATPQLETFIGELSRTAAVADDVLRPAMQKLINQTGDYFKSQELLQQAIEISRGSGVELGTVVNDLAQAYVGNTKGLKKYNLGLSQAELKTMSFTDVQKKLTNQFKGANAAYLQTYAGKMEALKVAAGEAQETIGKGLVDALMAISGDTTVEDLADSMQSLADYTANVIRGFGNVVAKLKEMNAAAPDWLQNSLGQFFKTNAIFGASKTVLDFLNKQGEVAYNKTLENPSVTMFKADMANLRLQIEANVLKKKELDLTKKRAAEDRKAQMAKKQAALFDLEKIGLAAALQGKITEEEKLRLNLQMALLTGNDKLAADLAGKLADSIDSTGKLKTWLTTLPDANNPFKGWDTWLTGFTARLRETLALTASGGSSQRDLSTLTPTVSSLVTGAVTGGAGSTSAGDVYITVNGSVLSEQDLVSAVQNGLNYNALAGKRSDIGRIAGMFG